MPCFCSQFGCVVADLLLRPLSGDCELSFVDGLLKLPTASTPLLTPLISAEDYRKVHRILVHPVKDWSEDFDTGTPRPDLILAIWGGTKSWLDWAWEQVKKIMKKLIWVAFSVFQSIHGDPILPCCL